jgi:periplasmic protein TonB
MKFFRDMSTLGLAMTISVIVHAGLLTVRFVDPERFNRVFQDTPLEVILVNAKTNEKPDVAKAIAQFNLAGGGEAEKGLAGTPLPLSSFTQMGEGDSDSEKEIQRMQQQQMLLYEKLKKEIESLPAVDPKKAESDVESAAIEMKRREMQQRLGDIKRRIDIENARPKKKFVSPSVTKGAEAIYYDVFKHKVEDKGTRNFPELAGNKLYGELMVSVTIGPNGQVLNVEIEVGSGNPVLDRRAIAIVKNSAPFGKFPDEMRKQAEHYVFVSLFRFKPDSTLETKLTSR